METSPTIGEIAKALTKFQSEVQVVKKDGENPHFKSKFATLENIIETIRKPLAENKLSFVQMPTGDNELATIIMHESGEYIRSTAKMELAKHDPQGQGSGITYMRRYALAAALGLATEEDDDGNQASNAPAGKTQPARPVAKPTKAVDPRKTKIASLVKKLDGAKFDVTTLVKRVKQLTDLDVAPDNFDKIIARLEAVIDERNSK